MGGKEKEQLSEEQEIRDEKASMRWRKYSRGLEALGLFQKSYADVTGCIRWLSWHKRSVFLCCVFFVYSCNF